MTTLISPSSYITADDLRDLDLTGLSLSPTPGPSQHKIGPTPHFASASAPAPAAPRPRRSSRSRSRVRQTQHVSFCPTVEQFSCAPDGERDEVLIQSHAASAHGLNLPRLAVKTYSLDGLHFGAAWSKVTNSLAASIQPILSPNNHTGAYGGGRVCQMSPRHESGADVWNGRSARQHEEEQALAEEDKRGGRMTIRLPGLTRKRGSRSRSCSVGARGILKRPTSTDGYTDEDELDRDVPGLSHSPSSPPVSEISSSPTEISALGSAPRATPTTHVGQPAALRPCCVRCEPATDLGSAATDADHQERFTKGAIKLREAEQRRQAEEAASSAGARKSSVSPTAADRVGATTGDVGVPAPAPFAKGRKVVIDELVTVKREQRQSDRRSEAEFRQRLCASPEEVLGFEAMEDRVVDPSPTSTSSADGTPPLSTSPLPSPTLAALDERPAQPSAAPPANATGAPGSSAARPAPKDRSSADDILPPAQAPSPKPPANKRKFSLSSLVFASDPMAGPTLPTELIGDIINLAAPAPNFNFPHPDWPEGVQLELLHSLSLVSRTFNKIASPLLYGHLALPTVEAMERFIRTISSDNWQTGERAGRVKEWAKSIAIGSLSPTWVDPSRSRVDEVLTRLADAKIDRVAIAGLHVRIDALTSLQYLKHLQLQQVTLTNPLRIDCKLRRLTHLHISETGVLPAEEDPQDEDMLSTPALTHLAVPESGFTSGDSQIVWPLRLAPEQLPHVAGQLEILVVGDAEFGLANRLLEHAHLCSRLHTLVAAFCPRVYRPVYLSWLLSRLPGSLTVLDVATEPVTIGYLEDVVLALRREWRGVQDLKVLNLPRRDSLTVDPDDDWDEVVALLDKLVGLAEERGVEVEWVQVAEWRPWRGSE